MDEVTVGDFRKSVAATDHETTAEREGTAWGLVEGEWKEVAGLNWRSPGSSQTDRHPVTCVSWTDAVAFCQWLSRKEGRTYRLPTEAQREYACRAGTQTVFSWGDSADAGEGYLNGADLTGTPEGRSWTYKFDFRDSHSATASVGSFKSNGWGLYDMHGNVYEWCSDWYGSGYYEISPSENPTGPSTGSDRVYRGGGWNCNPRYCRSACRSGGTPDNRGPILGFRVAPDPAE